MNVTLTEDDVARLGPHLKNYNHLNEILLLNELSIEDVQKMYLLEHKGRRRAPILRRLRGRITAKVRQQLPR